MTLGQVHLMPQDLRSGVYLVKTIRCYIPRKYSPQQLKMWFMYWLSKPPHTT